METSNPHTAEFSPNTTSHRPQMRLAQTSHRGVQDRLLRLSGARMSARIRLMVAAFAVAASLTYMAGQSLPAAPAGVKVNVPFFANDAHDRPFAKSVKG